MDLNGETITPILRPLDEIQGWHETVLTIPIEVSSDMNAGLEVLAGVGHTIAFVKLHAEDNQFYAFLVPPIDEPSLLDNLEPVVNIAGTDNKAHSSIKHLEDDIREMADLICEDGFAGLSKKAVRLGFSPIEDSGIEKLMQALYEKLAFEGPKSLKELEYEDLMKYLQMLIKYASRQYSAKKARNEHPRNNPSIARQGQLLRPALGRVIQGQASMVLVDFIPANNFHCQGIGATHKKALEIDIHHRERFDKLCVVQEIQLMSSPSLVRLENGVLNVYEVRQSQAVDISIPDGVPYALVEKLLGTVTEAQALPEIESLPITGAAGN